MEISELVDKLKQLAWPLTVFAISLIFRKSVVDLLASLAQRTKGSKIKIGDFEWTDLELDSIIADREILKTGIFIALADEEFSEEEKYLLKGLAMSMGEKTEELTESAKNKILHNIIKIASADEVIRSIEYKQIVTRARKYGIQDEKLKMLIFDECIAREIKVPDELKTEYDDYFDMLKSRFAVKGSSKPK